MRGRFVHSRLNDMMREHGWIVTGVPGKAFYTVGLMEKGHPELAVHGLTPQQGMPVLSSAVDRILKEKYVYTPGLHSKVISGFDVQIIEVNPSNFEDWFGQAWDYHRHWSTEPMRMLQILWPDPQGRFPGDPAYELKFSGQMRFDVRRPEYANEPGERIN